MTATDVGLSSIVARLEPMLGAAVGDPVALEGGITNRNYLVRLGAEDYVLRLPGKDTELLGISREAERVANRAAAQLGLAPPVAAALDDCLVTRFVPSRAVDARELSGDPAPVARALRAFHDCGVRLPVRFRVPDLVETYATIVIGRGRSLPEGYRLAREVAGAIAAAHAPSPSAPCHNDLLTANLIRAHAPPAGRTGEAGLLLVDWEYAGRGDGFFDLGNLSVNNDFDEEADTRLLSAYLGRAPDARSRARLRLMRAMSDVREAAWGVVQGAISELDFDFGAYAQRHFARLRETTSDVRFEEALHVAST